MTEAEFRAAVLQNPFNVALLTRLPRLGLAQCYLTAGCLFQAVWNRRSALAPDWGVKDYDVFYFDDQDLSWEAEDRVIRRLGEATADLPIRVDIKNQARVHLWYRERFGGDYPRLGSTRDGIERYLVSCTCIGIDVASGSVFAPDGFEDLAAGILRMNPRNARPDLFPAKARSYQARWPWLEIAD